ncbi:WD domain-containing protein [Biscogniauxia sp. FL1348]|nr:WD domain-containing protein [Biscogniauxia sp. FL1348]
MYNQGKIMRRLLGRPNTDSSSDGNLGVTSSPNTQFYRPNASQDATYPSTVPIASLDRSPDGRLVILGGRHILKTLHVDGPNIREGVDVRSVITTQFANKNAASSMSDQLSIKDAKLATNHGNEPTIFTACANGKIFMYDINRLSSGIGLEYIQTCEGSRQVNKLDFNPHRGTWLLSGGQDGIVRCFDVKAPVAGRNGPTFRTFQVLRCNADGIRDVKWAPKDGMIFACATESGVVLKWDIRKPTAPLLKINAHDTQKGVTSISWHPDGDHLISSGLDSKCYVWDLSKNAEKRQKPKWTINAPAPVTAVSWRPGLWSATAQGRRAAQVAVSYEDSTPKKLGINSVHIWDLGRPTMPYKEIDMFENSPYALLWHDQDLLWTVGQDGFTQCDVAFAPKVMDRQPLSSLDFSASGDVLMFLEERLHISRPRPTLVAHEVLQTSSYSSSPTGQMLSISRSDSEEDVIGSFLGPKRRIASKRRSGGRPPQTLSTTPPSGSTVEDQILPLEQAVKLTGPFRPQQVMAIGRVPASINMEMHQLLSRQYLEILERNLPYSTGADPLNKRVSRIMEQYAQIAESVSQFRLAQTWRILSYAMNLLLTRRSQYHLEWRSMRREREKSPVLGDDANSSFMRKPEPSPRLATSDDETPKKPASVSSIDSHQTPRKSLISGDIDSESNVPTPLARPVQEETVGAQGYATEKKLTPVQEVSSFTLPPAIHSERPSPRKRHDSVPLSIMSQDSQISSTEGYDFYDLEAIENLPQAIDVPKKKEPLTLDYMEPRSPSNIRKPVPRHDSDESFTQMFSLSYTSRQTSALPSSSGGSMRQGPTQHLHHDSSSANSEAEYGSRIRGKEISESPERSRSLIRRTLERQDSSNMTEDFMVSQNTTDTFDSDPLYVRGDHIPVLVENKPPQYSNLIPQERWVEERPEDSTSPTITETDFLPWEDDPPYPQPIASDTSRKRNAPPINPYDILSRALAFESKHSALHASAMILLLKPLVPKEIIDPHQASAILRHHHSRLMGMKLFVEAALLRNLCVRGWPEGIKIWGDNYPALFRPAQDRVAVGYICTQCHRPREVDRSLPDSPGVWKCERCRSVMAPCAVCGHREATADRLPLLTPLSTALIGSHVDVEAPMLSTWWYCPGCAHGGHANCLQDWHAPIAPIQSTRNYTNSSSPTVPDGLFPETTSDGCCPLDGCGHACLPGRWRDENNTARSEELGRAVREQTRGTVLGLNSGGSKQKATPVSRDASVAPTPAGSVRGDSLEVPQSRAVESVRGTLSANTEANSGSGVGSSEREGGGGGRTNGLLSILSSSPGRSNGCGAGGTNGVDGRAGGGERERRKSVKFVGPAPGSAADRW